MRFSLFRKKEQIIKSKEETEKEMIKNALLNVRKIDVKTKNHVDSLFCGAYHSIFNSSNCLEYIQKLILRFVKFFPSI